MCGLWGIASDSLDFKDLDLFCDLGMISSLRGKDSTGVMMSGFKKKGSLKVRHAYDKEIGNPGKFLFSPAMWNMWKATSPFFMAGHCRAATLGNITRENAHPFHVKHLTGMHNGTVKSFTPPKNLEDTHTDSRLIYEYMAEHGLVNTLTAIDDGAFALVWVNHTDRTLNFIRNEQRTLYWLDVGETAIMWASEKEFLELLDKRIPYKTGIVTAFRPWVHYRLEFGACKFFEVDLSQYKPKSKTPTVVYPGHWRSYDTRLYGGPWSEWDYEADDKKGEDDKGNASFNHQCCAGCGVFREVDTKDFKCADCKTDLVQDCPALPFLPQKTEPLTVEELFNEMDKSMSISERIKRPDLAGATYFGFKGKAVSLPRVMHQLSKGCSGCGAISDIRDEHVWFKETEYLCNGCAGNEYHKNYTLHGPHAVFTKGQLVESQQPPFDVATEEEALEQEHNGIRCG